MTRGQIEIRLHGGEPLRLTEGTFIVGSPITIPGRWRSGVHVAAHDSQLSRWRRLLRWIVPWYNPPNPKDVADYVCDGVNDEVEIQAAIDEGNTVLLYEGTFNVGAEAQEEAG